MNEPKRTYKRTRKPSYNPLAVRKAHANGEYFFDRARKLSPKKDGARRIPYAIYSETKEQTIERAKKHLNQYGNGGSAAELLDKLLLDMGIDVAREDAGVFDGNWKDG